MRKKFHAYPVLILAFGRYFSLMHYVKVLESSSKIIWFGFTRILLLVPGFTKFTKHFPGGKVSEEKTKTN